MNRASRYDSCIAVHIIAYFLIQIAFDSFKDTFIPSLITLLLTVNIYLTYLDDINSLFAFGLVDQLSWSEQNVLEFGSD